MFNHPTILQKFEKIKLIKKYPQNKFRENLYPKQSAS